MSVAGCRAGGGECEGATNASRADGASWMPVATSSPSASLGTATGVAPAAMQMGRHAARNVRRLLSGEATRPFRYRDKGSLATIGHNSAVAQFGPRLKLWGFPAWVAWLGIHIFFLIGFRNRFVVMTDWAVAYFTYQRHARLIFERRYLP